MSVQRRTDGVLWEELRKTVKDETFLATVTLTKNEKGFGFNIRGGTDHPHVMCDTGIFVTAIRAGSAASTDGRLAIGDRILAVNNTRLDSVTHNEAVMAFRTTDTTISLLVEKGAEKRLLNSLDEPPPSPPQSKYDNVDGPFEISEDKPGGSSIESTFTDFFKSTLGALTLGLMAGSLTVFVGMKVYKALK